MIELLHFDQRDCLQNFYITNTIFNAKRVAVGVCR